MLTRIFKQHSSNNKAAEACRKVKRRKKYIKTMVTQSSIHASSQKANLVCNLVRYQPVMKALIILDNTPNKTARVVKKVLNLAITNATNNHAMNEANLFISEINANQDKTLKRSIPCAEGSSSPISKRFVTI